MDFKRGSSGTTHGVPIKHLAIKLFINFMKKGFVKVSFKNKQSLLPQPVWLTRPRLLLCISLIQSFDKIAAAKKPRALSIAESDWVIPLVIVNFGANDIIFHPRLFGFIQDSK